MTSNTKQIARRVFLKVAAAQGIYQLSPDGLDMAMACPFIDATDIGLNIALACEIAARAEETIEAGGTFTAHVLVQDVGRKTYRDRVTNLLESEGGVQALYDDVQSHPMMAKGLNRYVRNVSRPSIKDFEQGIMPSASKPRKLEGVRRAVTMLYETLGVKLPMLKDAFYQVEEVARGVLRDLDLEFEDSQLKIEMQTGTTYDPMKVGVYIDGETFYVQDPFALDKDELSPKTAVPATSFLKAKGNVSFDPVFLVGQDLSEITSQLQKLNAYLNHPNEGVRTQAQEWLKTDQAETYLYRYIVSNSDTASKEVKAAARGFIKRIYKDYENAAFGDGQARAAKEFFGKDTKMLLQKCWNKSALKSSFGSFKISEEMLTRVMLTAVCKRISPMKYPQYVFKSQDPTILTDVITVIMVHTALSHMGVNLNPNLRRLLKI